MGLLDALLGRSKPVRPDLDQLFALPAAAVTLQAGADLLPTGVGSVCFASVEGGAFKQLQRDVRQLLDADVPTPDADVRTPDAGARALDPVPGTDVHALDLAPEAGVPQSRTTGVPVEFTQDEYGYTWLVARHPPEELGELVNDLHAVNTLLEENGFGPQLLCSLVGFQAASAVSETQHGRTHAGAGVEATAGGHRPLALVYLYKRGTFYPFAPRPDRQEKRDSATELQMRGLLTDDLPIEPDLGRWFPLWGAPGL